MNNIKIVLLSACIVLLASCGGRGGASVKFDIAGENTLHGVVLNERGKPVKDVVVSDGYTCVATDSKGRYHIEKHDSARFVFYSLPSRYEVGTVDGLPGFFSKLDDGQMRHDFSLTTMPAEEKKFYLFGLGDPQVAKETHLERFRNETAPDVLEHGRTMDAPCYAITLGDIVGDAPQFYPFMAEAMKEEYWGMPIYQVIGNHDHFHEAPDNYEGQKNFENTFGPLNYSFNRGDAHIVAMDNIIHGCNGDKRNYEIGFHKFQYDWLVRDLSFVPDDKLVILAVHAPFNQGNEKGGGVMNRDKYYYETLELLSRFDEAHIIAGHTHNSHNYLHEVNGKEIYEHDPGTTCGAWWFSDLCIDGTPNGYMVYRIEGPSVTDWYYKSTGCDRDFQLRIHRGSDIYTGGSDDWGMQFEYAGDELIIANVWNVDEKYWKVNVYEDDELTGQMTFYTGVDAWAGGYHYDLGRRSATYQGAKKPHMYHYTLTNPAAGKIVVEAVDKFGNKYYADNFTGPVPEDYPNYSKK